MKLYIADIRNISLDRITEISPERVEKALRLKKNDDKKRCIAGGLFINEFLKNTNITYNEYGKPVADNGIYFNLSHSGDYVAFAISDCNVGCDIQKTEFVKSERIANIMFCENEKQRLKRAVDKSGEFYKLWTKKESLLKCMGEGFHRNSKSVDVSENNFEENGKKYYLRTWLFSDYVICVCSEKNDFPKIIEYIEL